MAAWTVSVWGNVSKKSHRIKAIRADFVLAGSLVLPVSTQSSGNKAVEARLELGFDCSKKSLVFVAAKVCNYCSRAFGFRSAMGFCSSC